MCAKNTQITHFFEDDALHILSRAGNNEEHHQQQLDITSGLEFTSLHSDSDGLTANGEETRGPRAKNPEPGRTYECEVWCREASRQLAGCLGFTVLVLTYAVSIRLLLPRKP